MFKLQVSRVAQVNEKFETTLAFLADIKNIANYEPKVDSIRARPHDPHKGQYEVQGHFMGLKWAGKFDYQLNSKGFESQSLELPMGIRVKGRFTARKAKNQRTSVLHYEQYILPNIFLPLYPVLKAYLQLAMVKEMNDLTRSLEKN